MHSVIIFFRHLRYFCKVHACVCMHTWLHTHLMSVTAVKGWRLRCIIQCVALELVWKYILMHTCVAVPCRNHSAAYFDHTAAFEVPYRTHALCGLVRCLCISKEHMSSALNESSAIGRSECSNVIEICNGIFFNFTTRPSHIYMFCLFKVWLLFLC